MKVLALIRGINVGGVVLPMTDLKRILYEVGFSNCMTYIQSGNALFDSKENDLFKIEKAIEKALFKELNRKIEIIAFSHISYTQKTENHPFGDDAVEKCIYVTFLKTEPQKDAQALLNDITSDTEQFIYAEGLIFGYYGSGYGKSKFTNNALEKRLGVTATTRNFATVQKLRLMSV